MFTHVRTHAHARVWLKESKISNSKAPKYWHSSQAWVQTPHLRAKLEGVVLAFVSRGRSHGPLCSVFTFLPYQSKYDTEEKPRVK